MACIAEKKLRWVDLYAGRRGSVTLKKRGYGTRPWPYPENIDARVEWSLAAYRAQVAALDDPDDDRVPYLDPYTGTEIFAEAFGCRVHKPGDNMPFALPLITDARGVKNLRIPKPEYSSLSLLFEIADRLRAAEPDAVMKLPDIQSAFDVAALIWEKSDFYASMHEEPSAVKELAAMAEELIINFIDAWFKRYGTEFVAHYPDYYMPYGVTLSEDEAGAISPAMFEEFCLDSLNRLSERYGMLGMHCCADSEHQWENFKKIRGLVLLNLGQPDAVIQRAYKFFGDACAQMHTEEQRVDAKTRLVHWL